ncbi:MAG: histidine kinase [Acidimicrobiales bacterium]
MDATELMATQVSPTALSSDPAHEAPSLGSGRNGHGSAVVGTRSTGRSLPARPWSNSRFWILQLVILAIYLVRIALSLSLHLDSTSLVVELSTFALFLVPVLIAAFNYGLSGALATAAWVTLLAIPRVVSDATAHDVQGAWAEVVQVALLDALAVLIGHRVSAERSARELVDSEREAHLLAESLYRDLFDSNQAPILIVDSNGVVVETNAAAERTFGGTTGSLERQRKPGSAEAVRLVDMIGAEAAALVLSRLIAGQFPSDGRSPTHAPTDRVEPVELVVEGRPVLFRPTATMLRGPDAERNMQVVFEDVTAETRRHDRMEAYAAQVVVGQEEERRHIAKELHDGPVQTLVHLCRQIDNVEAGAVGERNVPALGDLRTIVEETVAELRTIAKGLRPPILDDLGLVASINQILGEAAERGPFEASFGVTGAARRLPAAVELSIFRIAQEALSNVERHSGAHRVAVGLDFESGGLRMLVKDDGIGFDLSAEEDRDGTIPLGVPGMRERAHVIGSLLTIHSAPGSGTTVDLTVPATVLEASAVR